MKTFLNLGSLNIIKEQGIMNIITLFNNYTDFFFSLLALQPPLGVVFYSPLAGFSLLAT